MSVKSSVALSFRAALRASKATEAFRSNGLLIFTLAHHIRAEDWRELAASSLTDGPGDCKVDALHIDLEAGHVIIAQSYVAKAWGNREAPANKASDLNTAVAWLLASEIADLPERLRAKANDLRAALRGGDVSRIDLLYVHNALESKNVEQELQTAVRSAEKLIAGLGHKNITVGHKEYGLASIESLYRARDKHILVEDRISVAGKVVARESGAGWKAIVVSVPGQWLHELFTKHNTSELRLFSANLREWLGLRNSESNINSGIVNTASTEPTRFWVYNNGITAISHRIQQRRGRVLLDGISVINGAQTCGALAQCSPAQLKKVRVLCRLVQCDDDKLVDKIVRFNNTQNEIHPADIVSRHPTQKRLAAEFNRHGVSYVHRRSSNKQANAISVTSVGPALCAFHGDPQTAGRNSKQIFLKEDKRDKVFPETITASHVFLVDTLARAIDSLKLELKDRIVSGQARSIESAQYEMLRYSMSKHFVIYLVGRVSEQITGAQVSCRHLWGAKEAAIDGSQSNLQSAWVQALKAILPVVAPIVSRIGTPYDVARDFARSEEVGNHLESHLESQRRTSSREFLPIRRLTTW